MQSRKEQPDKAAGVEPAPAVTSRGADPDYLILPRPEVVILLDPTGHILRTSAKYPGERLGNLTFERGRSVHDVLHSGCDGSNCAFERAWRAAWAAHRSGLPVEWSPALSDPRGLNLALRLQAVSYACGVLFGATVHAYDDCSVLFVRDNQAPSAE